MISEDHPIEFITVDKLELDPENPRLPESTARRQKDMLQYIARETSIEELMGAIGKNNYFPGEPLVAIKVRNIHRVVEGNRRLTALRLLQNPELVPKRKKIFEIANSAKYKPNRVPVVVFSKREDIISYLGYRHISGIKQWDSLSKARYMHQIFEKQTKRSDSANSRYKKVASTIGSRSHYIKRILDALALYNIMEKNNFYGISELEDETVAFSLLSTATGYDKILTFLNLKGHPIVKVQGLKHSHLKELAIWLFKKEKSGKTKLGESRQLKSLAHVVSTPKALKELKRGATLGHAFKHTKGFTEDFDTSLYEALNALEEVNATIANVDLDDAHMDLIEKIFRQAKQLRTNANSTD